MKTRWMVCVAAVALLVIGAGTAAWAHCQIPCGIYNDSARVTMLEEHVRTIEKSAKLITELSADPKANANQIARWVANKDAHADEFAEIVTYYFMAQRVKPVAADAEGYDEYVAKLTLLHRLLVGAMKTKQTADPAACAELSALVAKLHDQLAIAE